MVNIKISYNQVATNYTVCFDNWNTKWSSTLCERLGHKQEISARIVPVNGLKGPWVMYNSTDGNLLLSDFKTVDGCTSSYALAVQCQPQG